MLICCADIRGLDASRARLSGRKNTAGSAFARSLLLFAAGEYWGLGRLPEVAYSPSGKPYFPEEPGKYFSLSHTLTHVLAAVADVPVGADIETVRPKGDGFWERLMDEEERRDFRPFELWCLRESCYKLLDGGSLRSLRFRRGAAGIIAPEAGVLCRSYGPVQGCFAAACALGEEPPEELVMVPPVEICS